MNTNTSTAEDSAAQRCYACGRSQKGQGGAYFGPPCSRGTNCCEPVEVEILDPRGIVSYRRPSDDLAAWQALRTQGYALRVPNCRDMRVLEILPTVDGRGHHTVFDEHGLTIYAD